MKSRRASQVTAPGSEKQELPFCTRPHYFLSNFLSLLHRRRYGEIRRIVRDHHRLESVIEIRLSGPDRSEKVIAAIELMEPGTIYMVHDFLVQILHELRVLIRIFAASCHMAGKRKY